MGITLVLAVKGGCEEQHVLAFIVHPYYFTDEDAEGQRGATTCSNLLGKSAQSSIAPGSPDLKSTRVRVGTSVREHSL